MALTTVRFAQISDTHIFSDHNKQLLGVNTQESFDAVVSLLAQYKEEYDFIVHSGDLTQDNSIEAYKKVIECLHTLGKPIYAIPGNHDDSIIMEQALAMTPCQLDKQLIFQHWQIILLNTQKKKSVAGQLSEQQLQYLVTCLDQYPKKYAAIILHHHPLFVGAAWLDRLGLQDESQFWRILKQYSQSKAVFFGHVHQEHAAIINNIECYSVPSTCIQFKRHQDRFGLEELAPGFRLISLHADGTLSTKVVRLDRYIGYFDVDAKGY